MLLVRIGRKSRWSSTEPSVEEAVKDLSLRPEEKGLSVYKVDNIDLAKDVAKLFAPTARKSVDKIDFILFDESLVSSVEGLALDKTGCELHPELAVLHYEIVGLDEQKTRLLATAILSSPFNVERITEGDLIRAVRSRMEQDKRFKAYIYEEWASRASG